MTASDAKPARLRFIGFGDLCRHREALIDAYLNDAAIDAPPDHDAEVRIQSIRRAMMEDQ